MSKSIKPLKGQRSLFELMQDSAIEAREIDAVYRDPLPLIVAKQWNFPLQYHVIEGNFYFAVIDWVAGISTTDNINASKLRGKMKKQTSTSSRTLNYIATDGKTYQREYVTDEMLYKIVTYTRSTKDRKALKAIKDYLAQSGVIIDAVYRDPQKAKVLTRSIDRAHGIEQRKDLAATVKSKALRFSPILMGRLTNTMYSKLFKIGTEWTAKKEIVSVLNLTPTQAKHFRDNINKLALKAIEMAEEAANIKIGNHPASMTDDEILYAVKQAARIVAPIAWDLAEFAGVDLVTGNQILGSGK